jgi:hypothetical protein
MDEGCEIAVDVKRLVLSELGGFCMRSNIACGLSSRGVPNDIATAMSKAIAPEVWEGQGGVVVGVTLGLFYDGASGSHAAAK